LGVKLHRKSHGRPSFPSDVPYDHRLACHAEQGAQPNERANQFRSTHFPLCSSE
jgi:hypothetical protein